MKKLILILSFLHLLFIPTIFAQSSGGDFMQSIGKIYVVVAVIITIFIGIIIYLVSLDRKITNLEKQIEE